MKKIALSLTLATLTASHLTASAQITSGAYLGAAAGVSVLGGKNKLTTSNDGFVAGGPQQINNQMSLSLSKASPSASVFAGYGLKFSNFWAAAEVFYQMDALKGKQVSTLGIVDEEATLKASTNGAYGASVHLGFLPADNFSLYAILGTELRKFKVSFSAQDNITSVKIAKKYTSIAFVPGIGARFALTKNLSLKTEYRYAMHRSNKMSGSAASTVVPGQTDEVALKYQPRVHNFNIGFVYNF